MNLLPLIENYRRRLTEKLFLKLSDQVDRMRDIVSGCAAEIILTERNSLTEDLTFYPEGTKLFYKNNDSAIILIEQKPQVRTISISGEGRYRLAFPYILFLISFSREGFINGAAVAYSIKSSKSLQNKVFHPNLPNIKNFIFCFGEPAFKGSMADKAEQLVGLFWERDFGEDWKQNYFHAASRYPVFKTWDSWEKASKEDPLFPLTMDWSEQEFTVKELIGKYHSSRLAGISGVGKLNFDLKIKLANIFNNTWQEVNKNEEEPLDKWLEQFIKTERQN